jgi:hypothetical protein
VALVPQRVEPRYLGQPGPFTCGERARQVLRKAFAVAREAAGLRRVFARVRQRHGGQPVVTGQPAHGGVEREQAVHTGFEHGVAVDREAGLAGQWR